VTRSGARSAGLWAARRNAEVSFMSGGYSGAGSCEREVFKTLRSSLKSLATFHMQISYLGSRAGAHGVKNCEVTEVRRDGTQ